MQEGGQSYLIMPVSKACHSEMEKKLNVDRKVQISQVSLDLTVILLSCQSYRSVHCYSIIPLLGI